MLNTNPDLRYRKLWLALGFTLVAIVMYLSLTSKPVELDLDFPYQDKFFHALAYFVLMAWFVQIYHVMRQRVYHAIAFILLGISMEVIQSFDPARMAEFADMAANAAGVLIAIILSRSASFRFLLQKIEKGLMKNKK